MTKHRGIAAIAEQMARHGRYGDDMLVHMNKDEVQALARLNGGQLSRNPVTGQPEAFSLWKLLAGIGAAAAIPFTGGLSGAAFPALLGTAASLGLGSLAPSEKDNTKKMIEQQAALQKAQQEADRARSEAYTKDFVKIPMIERIKSPAPTPSTYTPGVDPERMQIIDQIKGYLGFAEGGAVPSSPMQADSVEDPQAQKIVLEAIAALQGKHPRPQQAIQAFVEMFGMDELEALEKEMTGGGGQDVGLLNGPGAGMDDAIPANVAGQRDVRLSDGEYVVPADVVAHLGDGSTKAGANQLEGMISRVRQTKTGKAKQPGRLNPKAVMPA